MADHALASGGGLVPDEQVGSAIARVADVPGMVAQVMADPPPPDTGNTLNAGWWAHHEGGVLVQNDVGVSVCGLDDNQRVQTQHLPQSVALLDRTARVPRSSLPSDVAYLNEAGVIDTAFNIPTAALLDLAGEDHVPLAMLSPAVPIMSNATGSWKITPDNIRSNIAGGVLQLDSNNNIPSIYLECLQCQITEAGEDTTNTITMTQSQLQGNIDLVGERVTVLENTSCRLDGDGLVSETRLPPSMARSADVLPLDGTVPMTGGLTTVSVDADAISTPIAHIDSVHVGGSLAISAASGDYAPYWLNLHKHLDCNARQVTNASWGNSPTALARVDQVSSIIEGHLESVGLVDGEGNLSAGVSDNTVAPLDVVSADHLSSVGTLTRPFGLGYTLHGRFMAMSLDPSYHDQTVTGVRASRITPTYSDAVLEQLGGVLVTTDLATTPAFDTVTLSRSVDGVYAPVDSAHTASRGQRIMMACTREVTGRLSPVGPDELGTVVVGHLPREEHNLFNVDGHRHPHDTTEAAPSDDTRLPFINSDDVITLLVCSLNGVRNLPVLATEYPDAPSPTWTGSSFAAQVLGPLVVRTGTGMGGLPPVLTSPGIPNLAAWTVLASALPMLDSNIPATEAVPDDQRTVLRRVYRGSSGGGPCGYMTILGDDAVENDRPGGTMVTSGASPATVQGVMGMGALSADNNAKPLVLHSDQKVVISTGSDACLSASPGKMDVTVNTLDVNTGGVRLEMSTDGVMVFETMESPSQSLPAGVLLGVHTAEDHPPPFALSTPQGVWTMGVDSSGDLSLGSESTIATVSKNNSSTTLNFTAQHRCLPDPEAFSDARSLDSLVGLLVSSTGRFCNLDMGHQPTVSDSLPFVRLTTRASDPAVYGVVAGLEDQQDSRVYQHGAFATRLHKDDGGRRLVVNGGGEGAMWVDDTNGPLLVAGDLITSSRRAGYGARQGDNVVRSHTVARIVQDCTFDPAQVARKRPVMTTRRARRQRTRRVETHEFGPPVLRQGRWVRDPRTSTREELVWETFPLYHGDEVVGEHRVPVYDDVDEGVVQLDSRGFPVWEDVRNPDTGEVVTEPQYRTRQWTALGKEPLVPSDVAVRAALVGVVFMCG